MYDSVTPTKFMKLKIFIAVILCVMAVTFVIFIHQKHRHITLPTEMNFYKEHALYSDILTNTPKFIVYVDSTDCLECNLKNIFLWKENISYYENIFYSCPYTLIICPPKGSAQHIINYLYNIKYPFPYYLDFENEYKKQNPWIKFKYNPYICLIDCSGQIVLEGNPSLNNKLWDKYVSKSINLLK